MSEERKAKRDKFIEDCTHVFSMSRKEARTRLEEMLKEERQLGFDDGVDYSGIIKRIENSEKEILDSERRRKFERNYLIKEE